MIYIELFLSFLKVGFSSFGGASMVPLINDEMLSHSWMTLREVSDIVAIAEVTPGPLGLNCATFAGTRVAGFLGAACATLGVLAPTFLLCSIVAVVFEKFKDSTFMHKILTGVRPVCLGLVLSVVCSLAITNYIVDTALNFPAMIIGAVSLICLFKFKWSIPKTILLSALLGLLLVR